MNINNIYIDGSITDNIYHNLPHNDKIMFIKVNKELFTRYKDDIRHNIFNYINNDYTLFYDCLKRFNYTKNEQKKLIDLSLKVNTVMTHTGTYGDLRFIFELCYKYEDIYKDAPLKERKLLSIMINEIYNSISFTRNEKRIDSRAFAYEDKLIWGASARMITQISEILESKIKNG